MHQIIDKIFNDFEANNTLVLNKLRSQVSNIKNCKLLGKIARANNNIVWAILPSAKIGDLCTIYDDTQFKVQAQVTAIDGNEIRLLPFSNVNKISKECIVERISFGFKIVVGDFLLGRVVNGLGKVQQSLCNNDLEPVDVSNGSMRYLEEAAPDALLRPIINKQLITGIKAIDAFIPCGIGQRLGIFAEPGVGKTTLLGMLLRNCHADVVVIALIGERGREVREFIDLEMSEEVRKKCVLVVATSDKVPIEQVKSAYTAQTIAEYFRDCGKHVLLLVDSITRFARASREVGLSSGESVVRGGFPASVFLSFPKLMERAGNTTNGSISAFYTVLAESGRLQEDPIVDEVKSIIDGHIILDKNIANLGCYPAINILASLSRIGDRLITKELLQATIHLRKLLAKYQEIEFLLRVGEYKQGSDKLVDEAVTKYQAIFELLKQSPEANADFTDTCAKFISIAQK